MWILIETNGYGLTPDNLDSFKESGVDALWLDVKAYDPEVHRRLTGVSNERILSLPREIVERGFTLEILSLYIPGWVETDQIEKIAELVRDADPGIPFTILAYFPAYQMKVRSPYLQEMLDAYEAVNLAGLENIRLGNIGIFAKTDRDLVKLEKEIGKF